jgi:hypothetical protein
LILWAILKPRPGEYITSQGNAHITEAQIGQFTYNTTRRPLDRSWAP